MAEPEPPKLLLLTHTHTLARAQRAAIPPPPFRAVSSMH
eukprot:SAG22_NODE_15648_length_344_cov_0.722449_1_plen_38_part_10